MPDRHRVSFFARADLDEIWIYSAKNWSVEQAEKYDRELHLAFERQIETPEAGEVLPRRADGARRLLFVRNCIAYLVDDAAILNLRVLHQNSDWQVLLAEE